MNIYLVHKEQLYIEVTVNHQNTCVVRGSIIKEEKYTQD